MEELPLAMQNELKKKFSKYEIEKSEKLSKDTDIFYEVELMVESDGEIQKHEILFQRMVKLLSKKKKMKTMTGEEQSITRRHA